MFLPFWLRHLADTLIFTGHMMVVQAPFSFLFAEVHKALFDALIKHYLSRIILPKQYGIEEIKANIGRFPFFFNPSS